MAQLPDYRKLRRLIIIYQVVQVFLVLLLAYMAFTFQSGLAAEGNQRGFVWGSIYGLIILLALFFPIRKLTAKEVAREIGACVPGLPDTALKSLRTRRMVGDLLKMSVFSFFAIFLYALPPKTPKALVWTIFLVFILTMLTYFQSFTFTARRSMRGEN